MSKLKHVMLDLEMMGITPQAPIVSIGAVMFDPQLNRIGKSPAHKYYEELDWVAQGRNPCQSTIDWWKKQSQTAVEALGGFADLKDVLIELAEFIPKGSKVWGNGSTFDISILEDAYRSYGLPIPWEFWNIRDCRTVVDLFEAQRGGLGNNRTANNHNALDDAINQAKYITKMYRKLIGLKT